MKELTDKERSEIQEAKEARLVNLMYHHVHQLMVQYINELPYYSFVCCDQLIKLKLFKLQCICLLQFSYLHCP